MKVLLSIKPEYADKIFSGEKKFEYRKVIFRRNVTTVVLYATYPVGRIVGEFDIDKILKNKPSDLWEDTKQYSGISQSFFSRYFKGKKSAYAIKVGNVRRYPASILPSTLIENFVAPQSFRYIET